MIIFFTAHFSCRLILWEQVFYYIFFLLRDYMYSSLWKKAKEAKLYKFGQIQIINACNSSSNLIYSNINTFALAACGSVPWKLGITAFKTPCFVSLFIACGVKAAPQTCSCSCLHTHTILLQLCSSTTRLKGKTGCWEHVFYSLLDFRLIV